MMSGGTERHELAVAALVRRLYPGARAAMGRTFANRQLRVPAGDHYYPGRHGGVRHGREPAV